MKMGKLQITAVTVSGTTFSGFTSTDDLPEYQLDEALDYLTEAVDEEDIGRLVLWSPRAQSAEEIYDKIVIPGAVLQVCSLLCQKWMNEVTG